MRCAICGTEIQGQPSHCPRCGTQLFYDPSAGQGQAQQTNPQGTWPGAQPAYPPGAQPAYPPGYSGYPPEGQATPPGYGPVYPQQMPPGPAYGAPAQPSMPLGAYPPPGSPFGAGGPPGAAPGYQTPYPPAYGQGQPYQPYGAPPTTPFGAPAPATTPFAPAAPPRRRANPLVVVLSIVCAVVVVAAAGAGLVYFTRHSGGPGGTSTGSATNTTGPTLLYQNTMTTPDSGWQQDSNCFFRSDGYHIVGFHLCFAPISDQKNVDITVDMNTLSGDFGSPHGIFLRHNSNPDRYEFDVDPYGHWTFYKCLAAQSKCLNIVDFTPNSAIHGGLHAVNTLEVIAVGTHFTFKVNGTQVGTADDSDLSVGAVGLAGNDNSEVVFSNLKITLPQQ
ncbi:MAG TPA: hypothetical protein VF116_16205 [Ktedonobacterales bacterium]